MKKTATDDGAWPELTLVGNWLGPHDGHHGDETPQGVERNDPDHLS